MDRANEKLQAFVDAYFVVVLRFLVNRMNDCHAAEDMAQEFMLSVCRRWHLIESKIENVPVARRKAYVKAMAEHFRIDQHRKSKSQPKVEIRSPDQWQDSLPEPDPERAASPSEQYSTWFEKLSDLDKELCIRLGLGERVAAIAAAFGVVPSTIYRWINRLANEGGQ